MDSKLNSLFLFIIFFSFFFFFFFFAGASATTQTPTTNPFEFIRSSCNATLYPDLCFASLSRYANYVRLDACQLARIAIRVSLARTKHTLAAISNMTHLADYGSDQRATSAVHDCASQLGDAVDQMRGSLKQMTRLGGTDDSEDVRFQLSNVQTWMSAALTNEETCTDGFQDVGDCPVKIEVCDKVGSVKEFTSNALALVNSFASSVGS